MTREDVAKILKEQRKTLVDITDSTNSLFEAAAIQAAMADDSKIKRARITDTSGNEIALTAGNESKELKALLDASDKASRYGEVVQGPGQSSGTTTSVIAKLGGAPPKTSMDQGALDGGFSRLGVDTSFSTVVLWLLDHGRTSSNTC